MKGIALVRVSTDSQDLKQQTDEVVKQMISDGYKKEDIILVEDKESGVKLSEEERQGLTKMKNHILNDPQVDSVYVYELSRLSRKPDVFYSIRKFLIDHKIQLVVIKPSMRLFDNKGNIDQNTMILFGIFSSMSEQEGYLRKERMSRGKRKCVKEGKWIGGYFPYGYKVDENNYIVINEPEAVVIRKIFNRYSQENISMRKLGMELLQSGELPTYDTYQDATSRVQSILSNEKYTGVTFGHLQMRYPPIIDRELFDKVTLLREKRKTEPKCLRKHIPLLQGIIRDGLTKRGLRMNSSIAMYQLYLEYPDGKGLQSSINLNVTDSVAWYLTVSYQSKMNPMVSQQIREDHQKTIKNLSKKIEVGKNTIEKLKEKEEKIQRRIISGKVSEQLGDKMLWEIFEKIEDLQVDIEKWEMERINTIAYCQMSEFYDDDVDKLIENLSSISDPQQKRLLVKQSIKSFDIYQIIPKKRYYMCEVTFMDNTTISFVINTYSKVVKYLDGNKMEYEYNSTIPREDMKQTYYKKKTDGNSSRSYNKPQPDKFFPHQRYPHTSKHTK